jgi:hypothetical protein
MLAKLFILAALSGLAGCGTLTNGHPLGKDGAGDSVKTIVPNKSVSLTPSLHLPLEGLLLGAALYWVVDPLSPNWRIEQTRLGENTFRIALRRKPFASGGEGEAMQTFQRRAEQIAQELGYTSYLTLEFSEGIESTLPVAQRVAQGVIRLTKQ